MKRVPIIGTNSPANAGQAIRPLNKTLLTNEIV
jgi:hypothetical protein